MFNIFKEIVNINYLGIQLKISRWYKKILKIIKWKNEHF